MQQRFCRRAFGFLSTPSARRATDLVTGLQIPFEISIHALCEEGDDAGAETDAAQKNFYPRPLRGGRPARPCRTFRPANFYPRPLRGGRLSYEVNTKVGELFLSTPSARRATPGTRTGTRRHKYFYPRPLRGGRRNAGQGLERPTWYFYPRPLRGGRRRNGNVHKRVVQFLSTPSARRATLEPLTFLQRQAQFLSTPSARRATW